MRRHPRALDLTLVLALITALVACAEETEEPTAELEPCGIRVCAVDENDDYDPSSLPPEQDSKSDAVDRVKATVLDVTKDGVLDVDDTVAIFEAAGGKISKGEIQAIHEAILEESKYTVDADALELARDFALIHGTFRGEAEELLSGETFAGTKTPEAVHELLIEARFNGAVAFDVNERDDDGEQIWTPYPATTPALQNMAFTYTQITPAVLQADIDDVDVEYNKIVGQETATTASGQEFKQASYTKGIGGTGHIISHYDEVFHPDIFARGRSGQKWANNFAILSDGSIHCLPAARRSFLQDLILTNPHLSRDKHMLFNGHLDIQSGVVVGVEMSGRLSKLAAKGKATFIDPIALLEAWGFEIAAGVRVRYGNVKHGTPVRNTESFVIEEDTTIP